jgi:hypothetical protein
MIRLPKECLFILTILLVSFSNVKLYSQDSEYPNNLDLGIRFETDIPSTVKINGVFGVSAQVYLEANSSTIPAGEWVEAKIELTDPDGIILDSYVQVWDGFDSATDGWLEEDPARSPNMVLFQLPWSQASKWGADKQWKISIHVDAPSVETNMTNNFASQTFNVVVPDLELEVSGVAATNPINGEDTTNYIPNTNYTVTGTVRNVGEVMTQAGVYIPVVAQLRKRSGNYFGDILDEQIILLPESTTHSSIPPNGSMGFEISELMMPADALGEYVITVTTNPTNIIGGPVMIEQSFGNNDGNFTFSISSDSNQSNENGVARIEFVENSFSGESGDFRGLDPTFVSLAVRNRGDAPVRSTDSIQARLVLSKDLTSDNRDFLLREFNLGGGGIGEGLLSGETVNLTWFQQLPDNLEGDYYLLIDITHGQEEPVTTPVDTTPMYSLLSQNRGTTELIAGNTQSQIQERPSISLDGRFVVYESPDDDGIQQIYLIDRQQANNEPVLISKSYLSTVSNEVRGNDDSFRPQISADGRKVVFYSRSNNLVIGDTNLKEDVFLYDLTLNTMIRPTNSDGGQLNGRSLYPAVNEDGSVVVFESDSTNVDDTVSGHQIYYWTIESGGSSGLTSSVRPLTNGNAGSYSPSIDSSGNLIVFDSYASDLLGPSNMITESDGGRISSDENNLRDIFLIDIDANQTYLVSYNYFGDQTSYSTDRPDPGHSQKAKISGDGSRIVFQSTADNLHKGGGIATIVVTSGGAGYQGTPTVEIVDTNVSSTGQLGSGAIAGILDDGINALQEIKTNGILVIDSGQNYVSPVVTIHPDPDFPAPTIEAKAVAYLSNPEGDAYIIDVNDVKKGSSLEGAKRISENINQTGGNFGSRDLSINYNGDVVVYATKSSNLLADLIERQDGKKFYNSSYILPKARAILVGGIGEIEIANNGYGYSPGNLKITDLSGSGSGAVASYEVDNRGRIVSIDIVEPGDNYNLDTTYVSVEAPRGGEEFEIGIIRHVPTIGEGTTRQGGAKIHKVEMMEYGYGYKIGETIDLRFDEIFDFEGDGADLNEDGFPDGKINPDRVYLKNGSLYLEQNFTIEVLSRVPELLNATVLEVYDNNHSIDPIRITFDSQNNLVNGTVVGVNGLTQQEIRDSIIEVLRNNLDSSDSSTRTNVLEGPRHSPSASSASFWFSALSGRFSTNNPQAIQVVEHSNMLIAGSGYTRATPIINQVPSIYGFSEIDGYPQITLEEGVGRSTLLSQPDLLSDDIYLYDVNTSENHRISLSSYGTPAGYIANDIPTPPSSRFPVISGNGRYIAFSSDVYGVGGLVFDRSNQDPLLTNQSPSRNLYLRDLKTFVIPPPDGGVSIDLLIPNNSKVFEFASQTPIPIFADFNYSGDYNMSVYLNRKRLTSDQISLERFQGGEEGGYMSNRFTGVLDPSRVVDLNSSGDFTLELVAFGEGNVTIAVSQTVLFRVTPFTGSLPPRIKISEPRKSFTSRSVFPLSASADDPDGAVHSVTFYVNGVAVKNGSGFEEILRTPGIVEENVIYSLDLDINKTISDPSYSLGSDSGILSVIAIARDSSGNFVTSETVNLSYTKGSTGPEASLSFGGNPDDFSRAYRDIQFFDELVNTLDFNITLGASSGIASVDLNVSHFLGDLKASNRFYQLDVYSRGDGQGAKLVLDYSNSKVDVVLPGKNYDDDNSTTIRITPLVRSYNQGESAKLVPNDTFTSMVVAQSADGIRYVGDGYSIFPRARPLPANLFPDSSSITIPIDIDNVAGRLPFPIPEGFVIPTTQKVSNSYDVVGGFAQSPILLSVEVNQTYEAIESVSLLIDGSYNESLTKYSPSYIDSSNSTKLRYDFSWVPEVSKYYSISTLITDMGGNVISTPLQNIFIDNFDAGGITIIPLGGTSHTVESDGTLALSVDVNSQFNVELVEFFIDDIWVARGENRGGSTFQAGINLEKYNFRPGVYEISYRAIDERGNMAGTFSRHLTNIVERQNHILMIIPPSSSSDTNATMVSPVNEISITPNSTIRLTALANDESGNLAGLRFFAPQDRNGTLYSWRQVLDLNGTIPADGATLTIDDGTGKKPLTFEFDNDNNVVPSATPPYVVGDYNNKKDDLEIASDSTYTASKSLNFVIEIDSTGSVDTFKWSKDGGQTFVGEKIAVSTSSTELNRGFGIKIKFGETTGHALGDKWSFIASPQRQIIQLVDDNIPQVNLIRTRNNLYHAIKEANERGLISIEASIRNDANLTYLHHTNDLHYLDVNLSGTAFSWGGGTIETFYQDGLSQSDYNYIAGVESEYLGTLIEPRFADSKLPQPFGLTWQATAPGEYYFFGIAEDYSGSESVTQSVKVTVSESSIGLVPEVELEAISPTTSYLGSALTIPLRAEANDLDGTISAVEFYVNGELIFSDTSRPFEANAEINATGYYEIFSVARDNVGNLTTSNVESVLVDSGGFSPTEPLTITFSPTNYQGGLTEILGNYKSLDGNYSDFVAYVYLNDAYLGEADKIPYSPPSLGEEDAGQSFVFELYPQFVGDQQITILVSNGSETATVNSTLTTAPSPLLDDEEFIKVLFNGLYARPPEPYELSENLSLLENKTSTRAQLVEKLRSDYEFVKAKNIILSHKTIKGSWKKIDEALLEAKDPEETNSGSVDGATGTRPDDPGDAGSATLVPLNTPITASIESANDIDYFQVQTLGAGKNTTLTITVSAGHPGVYIINPDPFFTGSDRLNIVGPGVFPIPSVLGFDSVLSAGPGSSSTISVTYNLANFEGDNSWYVPVPVYGNAIETGDYTIQFTMEIPQDDEGGGIAEPSSPVIDFNIGHHLWYWADNLQYLNSYGEIGTHNPESFFTRLFKNRYEQAPSPAQIARGVHVLNEGNFSQFEFLQALAVENKVLTVGAYNYTYTDGNGTTSLNLPNVPLDVSAFAETALVYTALTGDVPANGEVARITLTPEYLLRPMTERAKMIMELPAYAARFGMAMPEVDLPNLRNGRTYNSGDKILIDASSLGPDNLANTKDDGHIREIKILFNGSGNTLWSWTPDSTNFDSNISKGTFYYDFNIPDLPTGQYLVEVIAEDKNGLISGAKRNISIGSPTETLSLTSPQPDKVLDIDEVVEFKFSSSNSDMKAYLEVNGHIPWVGNLQFSGDDLPADESNFTISDGAGGEVTFEFDDDFSVSSSQTSAAEKMYVVGEGNITTTTSNYTGSQYREYIIEIDGDNSGPNGHDTFRWSIDGGAHFNDSAVEIDQATPSTLSAGIVLHFDSDTDYLVGDRWRIKAYPTNEIVEIGKYGGFADRLSTTRENLVHAINRANNDGKLALRAKISEVDSTSSGWFDSYNQNRYGVEIRYMGDFPVFEQLTVDNLISLGTGTTLSKADWLVSPWQDSGTTLSLDLRKMGFSQPMLKARVVAFDDQNNTIYSEPRSFTLRDPSRMSIELTDPIARKASIRLKSSASGTLTNTDFEILDGGAGYTGDTAHLSIISEYGTELVTRLEVDQLGEVSGVVVLNGGKNYTSSDLVMVSSPLQYKVGDSVSVSAKVRDPLSELDRVAFYVNGVELDVNSTSGSGTTYSTSYEFTDESAQFVTARALYGDDRDRGPNTIAEDEWMSGPGIAGDRINYWGWRRHWAEQHFHGPGYVFPEWFIQDQDYWALPPPWLSLPYGPGAVPIQVAPEVEEDPISVSISGTAHIGSVQLLDFTFRSEDREYEDDLNAYVYVDGQLAGIATKLDYDVPEYWEADPGYQFEFALPVHTTGDKEVEIFVTNGADTFTTYTTIKVEESPFTDDYQFLKSLWNGLFDRDPESAEINAYLAGLRNGSMTRPQVIEHIRTQQEFITSRDVLLTHKTLHGVWEKLPIVLENTDQQGYGSMGGGGSTASQAVMGMPYTPADGNESDLGFYEGVADDHGNIVSNGTWISMNSVDVMAIISPRYDMDTFKIKSQNLANEGSLKLSLFRRPFGTIIPCRLFSGATDKLLSLSVHFKDGTFKDIDGVGRGAGVLLAYNNRGFITWDLSPYQNVDFYSFKIGRTNDDPVYGGVFFTTENTNYLNQANFLTEEEIAQLQIESRVNSFDLNQAVSYQTNSFSYTNRYGQIETHDPASFFHRLFLNKYDQEPNPMQTNRGVQLLKEGTRSQVDFLQQFATENNIITVGGYNYTTSANELAIPNVPIDAVAFAETALVYSALMSKAPSKAEVAKLTLDPYFEVRPLAERARLILEMPEYAAQYGVSVPKVDFWNIQNGDILEDNDVVVVEAYDFGIDGVSGTYDDGKIDTISLLLNGVIVAQVDGSDTSSIYTFTLGQGYPSGEYLLEVIAKARSGHSSRSHRQVFLKSNNSEITITTPAHGSVLQMGSSVDVNYQSSKSLAGTSFLEINGKIHWSGMVEVNSELMQDNTTLSLYDGTGRSPVIFELDSNQQASAYLQEVEPIRKIGTGDVTVTSSSYSGPAEGIEYLVFIDGNGSQVGSAPDSFSWMEAGAFDYNETAQPISGTAYSLGYGITIDFTSTTAFEYGDAWRIKVTPSRKYVAVGTDPSYEGRLADTKANLIRAINQANSRGDTALRAYDPAADTQLSGMLPLTTSSAEAIVLRLDGSYPVISDVYATRGVTKVSNDLFGLIKANSGGALKISNWDAWSLSNGVVDLRVVHIASNGSASYSDKRTYPLVDPSRGFVELVGPFGSVNEPGRLPTIHFEDGFSNSLPSNTNGQLINIVDGGGGYNWFDEDTKPISVVSSTGSGGQLMIQDINSNTNEVTSVYANSNEVGSGYSSKDVIVPSPPAFFALNDSMALNAKLRDPYGEYQRVAFYVNGVEVNSTVQDRTGGIYGTLFPMNRAGDQFITARALYGDSRDFGPNASIPLGQDATNQQSFYAGKDYWGWKKSWIQQHYATGREFLPIWFRELNNYWINQTDWDHQAMWDGASPVRVGKIDVYESVTVSIDPSSSAFRREKLLHAQCTSVSATVQWDEGRTPNVSSVHLYGNNVLIGEILEAQTDNSFNRISWDFEWLVNYKLFKHEEGQVDLTAIIVTEEGRQIASESKRVEIRPLSLTDPASTIAMIYMDLTGECPNDSDLDVIEDSLDLASMSSLLESMVNYTSEGENEYMADLIAAYHVTYGRYHSEATTFYEEYDEWRAGLMENRAVNLQAYITQQIISPAYSSKYGQIPNNSSFFFGILEGLNLGNRTAFVKRHYKNKYGTDASPIQYLQGAQKMWQFAGGNAAANNFEMNRQAATDFIYNLATEPVEKMGLYSNLSFPYLNGMKSLRPTYKEKAVQYILSKVSKQNKVTEQVEDAIDETLQSRSFRRRFNLLWEDSETYDEFKNWKHEEWLGYFNDDSFPWIYHADLGWLYSSGTSHNNVWFYSPSLGWFWTNRETYRLHPNLTADNQRFIYRVSSNINGTQNGTWSLVTILNSDTGSARFHVYNYGYSSL